MLLSYSEVLARVGRETLWKETISRARSSMDPAGRQWDAGTVEAWQYSKKAWPQEEDGPPSEGRG